MIRRASLSLVALTLLRCATNAPARTHPTRAARAPASVTNAPSASEPRESLRFLSIAHVELDGPAPRTLAEAQFELSLIDAPPRAITPVRAADDASAPTEQHTQPSFIVDFDQDPLRAQCASATGVTAQALLQRASDMIEHKSMAVGFITASATLRRREGDCTEHSVLAAALLRCNGIAARLSYGLLVVRVGDRIGAGHHMWTERYEGGWRVADATFPERDAEVVHLRLGSLTDEGPAGLSDGRRDTLLSLRAVRVRAR